MNRTLDLETLVLADRAQLCRRLDAAEAASCKHDEAGG